MMNIKPCYPHILFIGKQRCGKDLLILNDLYCMKRTGRSIFHRFLMKENLDFYADMRRIYANCEIDKKIFPENKRINTLSDIENARGPAILWLHDADLWFNSRDIFMVSRSKKEMSEILLHQVNNLGKLKLSARISCHRRNSLDVKLRELMNLKVLPKMKCIGGDRNDFKNWEIHFKVFDEWDEYLGMGRVRDPYKVANYYNTEETVKALVLK